MNLLAYNLILHLGAPFLGMYYLPAYLSGRKYGQSLPGKLGRLPADFSVGRVPRPLAWFHAVSVGEVVALAPLIREFRERQPQYGIVVSTGTETGQEKARTAIEGSDGFLYLPLDLPSCTFPVVDAIRPDLFVLMETELWPNLLSRLRKHGARIALANGRISDRSFPRYRFLRSFFRPVLEGVDLFLMTSAEDAERIAVMGAPRDRVHVTGNTKFDAALTAVPLDVEQRIRSLLDLPAGTPVWVAGSTHPGEHEHVLDAYLEARKYHPDLVLVAVPRHVDRMQFLLSAMATRNLSDPFTFTAAEGGEKRNGRDVVVVDKTGELFRVFSAASVVFMGGSLVPRGGQNILEPAAWGKPVLFGPSMEDFREAREILMKTGAGREVTGPKDLAQAVSEILRNSEAARVAGNRGREALMEHVGSARRNAVFLCDLLADRSPRTVP
jgi:3-deoxy-D-manno-octulosonic-acid transferase